MESEYELTSDVLWRSSLRPFLRWIGTRYGRSREQDRRRLIIYRRGREKWYDRRRMMTSAFISPSSSPRSTKTHIAILPRKKHQSISVALFRPSIRITKGIGFHVHACAPGPFTGAWETWLQIELRCSLFASWLLRRASKDGSQTDVGKGLVFHILEMSQIGSTQNDAAFQKRRINGRGKFGEEITVTGTAYGAENKSHAKLVRDIASTTIP